MKRILFSVLALCGLSAGLSGQASITLRDGSLKKLTQEEQDSIVFVHPTFIEGTVLFLNGQRSQAEMNYNCYSQQLLFKQKNAKGETDILSVSNMPDILMVSIADKTFMPVGNSLAEVLVDDRVSLLSARKVSSTEKKTGGYGTGGNTAAISNLTSFDGGTAVSQTGTADGGTTTHATSGAGAGLDRSAFGPNSTLTVSTRLFLMKDMKIIPLTKKNLLKAFPKSGAFIERYFELNKVDLANAEQMTALIGLCLNEEKK